MIEIIGAWALPLSVVCIVAFGLFKGVKVFDCFAEGAKKGLLTAYRLLPSITALVLAVTMLQKSGGAGLLSSFFLR